MPTRAETLARASAIRERFVAAGAVAVETPILQPAELLLDLYGEDIRARAYVTSDALRGEQVLRPDFTLPVVQMHMATGTGPARYTYAGEVFRRQEEDESRANEYVQVGLEVFDHADAAEADAELFVEISQAVARLGLRAATGDIGILTAAVDGLSTTEARKAALHRHLWRPRRFRALLDRFSEGVSEARAALLAAGDPFAEAGAEIGLRSRADVESRLEALRLDAAAEPIGQGERAALEALLKVRETVPFALAHLRDISVDLPSIAPALDRLEARANAMHARGIAVDRLDFEASYGRTSMEYYDGFVFGFYAEGRPDLPPIATGGRYDALTRRLGRTGIPAVGAVLRPGLMLELEEAGA